MPAYDGAAYAPPAPVAWMTIDNPASGQTVGGVAMLMDTGADITLLPRSAIASIVPTTQGLPTYDLVGFDGHRSSAPMVNLDVHFMGKRFRGRFLVIDQPHGIL